MGAEYVSGKTLDQDVKLGSHRALGGSCRAEVWIENLMRLSLRPTRSQPGRRRGGVAKLQRERRTLGGARQHHNAPKRCGVPKCRRAERTMRPSRFPLVLMRHRSHITLELESINRMHLGVSLPKIRFPDAATKYLRYDQDRKYSSLVLRPPVKDCFIPKAKNFVAARHVPTLTFCQGQSEYGLGKDTRAAFVKNTRGKEHSSSTRPWREQRRPAPIPASTISEISALP